MLIQRFEVINNERKILTHYEIIDRIARQIDLTQVYKQSKLWIHPNVRLPRFLFTYSFKFAYVLLMYGP